MDQLFKEYADPFSLLDNVIPYGGLCGFLETFNRKHEERIRWEFYLHKLSSLDDRSWDEFNEDLDSGTAETKEATKEELTNIIRDSYNMINTFVPD